ncbi:hypothetical protein RFN25_15490 [Mesorhizobium abyssinicae]|uniref:hypothetical protein n=1 Tax=Mesorhizobium abyssinicae TaxID=1209958 RepID=UPI002A244327|nr:hypothetical protein [Mesorhizobium abyssinicae]MDX8434832.1 hypothetical protein [Mesorhizobium abyssinicae]
MLGVEMLDHHIGKATVGWNLGKEFLQCPDTARRRAYADEGEEAIGRRFDAVTCLD